MWQYWLLFVFPAFLAISNLKPKVNIPSSSQLDRWPNTWRVVYFFLVLMIGLRHEVGGDWVQYLEMLESYLNNTSDDLSYQDPAYILLNKFAAWSGGGVYVLNLISAIFFTWGLIEFCRSLPRPWLALVVAVPYLITVVAMGYTRQSVAIGIAMAGMLALSQGKTMRFVVLISFAALFHKSAVILIPVAILGGSKQRFLTLLWVTLTAFILFVLLLQEASNFLIWGYIDNQYQSSGAAIRIAMNAVPGAIFILFRKRFKLSREQLSFWTWMAWGGLLFVVLLIISPSSTAVDRVALYWIPLQLFVLSQLPNALGNPNGENRFWVYAVVIYSAVVHFVWLVFADTAFAWLPYQFFPWVWLWK